MNKMFHNKNAGLIASLSAFFVLFSAMFDPWISFWLAAAFLGLYLVYWLMANSKVKPVKRVTVRKTAKRKATKSTRRKK